MQGSWDHGSVEGWGEERERFEPRTPSLKVGGGSVNFDAPEKAGGRRGWGRVSDLELVGWMAETLSFGEETFC